MLPRQELAFCACSGALGIFFINFSCGILAVAFGCGFPLFVSDTLLEPTLFGRTRVQVCCFPLEGPPESSKRTFLALKVRGHIETLCCCRTCNTLAVRKLSLNCLFCWLEY